MASIHDQIQRLTSELEHVALTKGLAPIRRVNKAFNRPLHPEVFDEAMNRLRGGFDVRQQATVDNLVSALALGAIIL